MKCPCNSGNTFDACCQAIIEQQTAQTPEQLMRSRYSAYATQNATYLYHSYAKATQPNVTIEEIKQWASENQWVYLIIHSKSNLNDLTKQPATVEFSAFYINQNKLFELREYSRFVQEQQAWKYLDGDIISHQQLQKIARNDNCPCRSGKKYKKCCGNK